MAGILDPASRQDETGCGRLRKYDLTIASGAGASSLSWLAGPLVGRLSVCASGGASPEIQWGCRSDLCQYTKIYVNLRFSTKFRKGNLTPVKFSFSTIFDIFRRLLLRERDWNQGGILAGGDLPPCGANTTACPLMEGHGSPWATPKQPQLFGPAARRGPLKFRRVQGPFSKGRLVAVRRQRNSLPAAAAAGVADQNDMAETSHVILAA